MVETRHKPDGKWIVQAIDHKLTPMQESATPRRWRSFSPDMWSLYVAWIGSLQQPVLWTAYSDEVADTLPLYALPEQPPETECPECPDCPDCPEPPPPQPEQPPAGGGGSGSAVGRLGMTLEELEDYIMGWSLRGQLKWVNGKLCYWSEGCCDWVEIEDDGQTPIPITPAGLSAIADGSLGLTAWEQQGSPNLSSGQTPIPSSIVQYNTSDVNKCLKASAFVGEIRELLDAIRDGISESAESFVSRAAVVTGIVNYLGIQPFAGILTWVSSIVGYFVGKSKADTVGQLNDALADLEAWNDVICALTPKMQPTFTFGLITGNNATDADYNALVDTIVEIINPGAHVMQILNTYPLSSIKERVRERLETQECECGQYLPADYEPPLADGEFRFTLDHLFKAANASGGLIKPQVGQPFSDVDSLSGEDGVLSNGYPMTEMVADDSGYFWCEFGALFELSEIATITSVKVSATYPNGNPTHGMGMYVSYFRTTDNTWQTYDSQSDVEVPFQTEWVFTNNIASISHLALRMYVQSQSTGGQQPKHARILSIRISGSYGGGETFTELELNEVHAG